MQILQTIEEYKDVEALDIFKDFTERKGFSKRRYPRIYFDLKSRDNARTPMQWDASEQCRILQKAQPWIRCQC